MRKQVTFYIILLCSVFVILSCEKEINVKIPYDGDEYVVYGELPLGEPVSVYVTKTSAIDSVLDFEVDLESLTVILYEDDKIMDTLELFDNTFFKSDNQKPTKLGMSYFVNIFHNSGDLIAQTQSQTPIKILEEVSIKVKPENIKGLNVGVPARELVISIDDNDPTPNYYGFDVIPFVNGNKSGLTTFAIGRNPDIKDDCGYFFRDGYIFTDKCFIDNLGVVSHGMELRSADVTIMKNRVPDSVVVTFKTMDRYFYDYFATITDVSIFENAFVSPKPLKSNMRKGLGIWSPVNTRRFVYIPDIENL